MFNCFGTVLFSSRKSELLLLFCKNRGCYHLEAFWFSIFSHVEFNIYLPVIFIFSAFSTSSTDSTDTFLARMNRDIHSVICKVNNIVWWSSQVQINPYTSRSFLDHVCSYCSSPSSFLPPALPWLVSSHISVSHFSSHMSSCLQHVVSWPSSMASTHWEHCFVCWSKRACFEPCTWSQSMMMSECHLSAGPWKMVTTLCPSLSCLVLLLLLLRHPLLPLLWHCCTIFCQKFKRLVFSMQGCTVWGVMWTQITQQ